MRYKVTVLTPIHIGSGSEFELYYNMLIKDSFVYIYDEFKIAQFFIDNNIEIKTNFNELKKQIKNYKDKIIQANIHKRKIQTNFTNFQKPLLEQVSTANKPIITGSSIKGAIRTAYINKLVEDDIFVNEERQLQNIDDELYNCDYQRKKELKKEKRILLKEINKKIDKKTKSIFKYIKVSDSFDTLQTKVYKTINIKKEKNHQINRSNKISQIANFAEAIQPNQEFFIDISTEDEYFNNLINVCNAFYDNAYESDFNVYFANNNLYKKIELQNKKFLLNVGRFGGAELKSIEEIRRLPKTSSDMDWKTSARTYALENDINKEPFFEKGLFPFGWMLCEVVE